MCLGTSHLLFKILDLIYIKQLIYKKKQKLSFKNDLSSTNKKLESLKHISYLTYCGLIGKEAVSVKF